MKTSYLVIILLLVVVMGMVVTLCSAETRRLGRELAVERRTRDALIVQYERMGCERSKACAPSYVRSRVLAMGIEICPPSAGEQVMYARASTH